MDRLLLQCKFSKRYKGYYYLKTAVEIVQKDEMYLLRLTKLYTAIAHYHNTKYSSVEQALRTAIDNAWKTKGCKEQLEFLTGAKFFDKPTAGEMIELLAYINTTDEYLKIDTKHQ